jgi:lipopolysaccharide heptosyltransferase II
MTAPAWGQAEHVLCVRLDALGDVLMTGPAMRALKYSRAGRRVTLLTSPAGAAIAPYLVGVDDVLVYQAPWMKATPARADASADRAFIEQLRTQHYDAAVIFTVYSQNPLPAAQLCYLAEIPLRLAHCRENPYQLLTDWVPEREPAQGVRHEVRRQLDLVAHVGALPDDSHLRLRLPPSALNDARQLLRARGVNTTAPWVVIHPGASAPSRRYDPVRFAAAARELVTSHGCTVVFSGSRDEASLIGRIQRLMRAPSHSFAGELDTAALAALIALAPVLVANNTGPVHIAAALGTPVVDLYALTNPQHTPWGVEHRLLNRDVPCKLCYKSVCPTGNNDCLRVAPEDVVRATLELLARDPVADAAPDDRKRASPPARRVPSAARPVESGVRQVGS